MSNVFLLLIGFFILITALRFILVLARDKSLKAGYEEIKSSIPFIIIMLIIDGLSSTQFADFLQKFGKSGSIMSIAASIIGLILVIIVMIKVFKPSKTKYKEAQANGESFFKAVWLAFKKDEK
ncbi:hypothetical protein [uncultured Clostridium sp.]|uniref:hypothetical protein n=1 Tax=uncultured Clostridium sp. TaxID=59620 RepID=UPI0026184CEA|nr:hypothetical protein [uncultured Clostridium sp.]